MQLTTRHMEVITLVAQAKQDKEIARDLDIDFGTVKNHVVRALRITKSKNRTELAVRFVRGEFDDWEIKQCQHS